MVAKQQTPWERREAHGISVIIAAVAMIFVLGMAGLAIDLASLYVGRAQAQRAADAAALAAAQALVNNSCFAGSGGISSSCQALATDQAKLIGNANLIAGVSPNIQDSDVTFDLSNLQDPRITVVAARDTARGNPMPTFFVKIFGVNSANVSAQATAEAFDPSGTGQPIGVKCVKPWFFPNCDAGNTNAAQKNPDCSPSAGYFVVPDNRGTVARPDLYPSGVVGEPFTMKPGTPGSAAAPGQYYAAFIPDDTLEPTLCPECAKTSPGGGGSGSAAVYRQNISCCNQNTVVCGVQDVTIASSAGNMVGPTRQGVDCLIHQPTGCGQDYLDGTGPSPCNSTPKIPNFPFKVIPGANNPFAAGASSISLSSSDSVVAVPIYKGILQSGQNQVEVIGFMKIFLKYEDSGQQGTVYAYILEVTGCGSGGSGGGTGSGGGVITTGGSTIPVRLIRTGS